MHYPTTLDQWDLSSNDRIEDEGLVPTFLKDFELMLPYFQQANYMAIDGKIVVYMAGSHESFFQ
jgi:hypothetical protein